MRNITAPLFGAVRPVSRRWLSISAAKVRSGKDIGMMNWIRRNRHEVCSTGLKTGYLQKRDDCFATCVHCDSGLRRRQRHIAGFWYLTVMMMMRMQTHIQMLTPYCFPSLKNASEGPKQPAEYAFVTIRNGLEQDAAGYSCKGCRTNFSKAC